MRLGKPHYFMYGQISRLGEIELEVDQIKKQRDIDACMHTKLAFHHAWSFGPIKRRE